jgi:enoyl-CoA hydratase
LQLGLVDAVVPRDSCLSFAHGMAARLLARGPAATQATKMLINAVEGEDQERVLEALAGTAAASSADLKVGIAAFRSKTKPEF